MSLFFVIVDAHTYAGFLEGHTTFYSRYLYIPEHGGGNRFGVT
jgi:hypothetical protein